MIKQLKKTDVMTSPFRATKARELYNVQNDACPILEPDSSSVYEYPDENIALDYVDYLTGTPLLNRDCNIALEQQTDDVAVFEYGTSGSFNPSGSKNFTGTYETLVYRQIQNAFYNDYRNPVEIFGMENIDFPLSTTNRYLADAFRMITIPRMVLGDKISPGSVEFADTLLDDNVTIYDDSNENLVAGFNIFSKVQEVRSLGNDIQEGTASYTCPVYYDGPPIFIPNITANLVSWPSNVPLLVVSLL